MMAQYIPYVVAAGSAYMLVIAVMVNSKGTLNSILFKMLPALISAALMWASIALFMGAA
jgi:hypothetical protein